MMPKAIKEDSDRLDIELRFNTLADYIYKLNHILLQDKVTNGKALACLKDIEQKVERIKSKLGIRAKHIRYI